MMWENGLAALSCHCRESGNPLLHVQLSIPGSRFRGNDGSGMRGTEIKHTMTLRPFHLAFPVNDLAAARVFYGETLGCPEGRSSNQWIDFNFYGHQIVTHLTDNASKDATKNPVDGQGVPVPHFGIVLTMDEWKALAAKLRAAGTKFEIEPTIRFKGKPGEQATMFLRDPSGNALEMKAFASDEMLFAS